MTADKHKKTEKQMLTCQRCNKTSEEVRVRIDPYVKELFGREVEVILCNQCYQESVYDI